MELEYFESLFEKYETECYKFKKIENKLSNRPDLHAFILLDKLSPSNGDIVAGAEHDEIYLGIDIQDLLPVITDEQVLELIRCGVMYNEESLCMFA